MHEPQATPRQLLSIQEACQVLSIGRTMLYSLAKKRELRILKIGRRSFLAVNEIEKFVQTLSGFASDDRSDFVNRRPTAKPPLP